MGVVNRHMPALSGRPNNPFEIADSIRRQRVLGYRAVQVLEYIRVEIIEHGEAPSYGMIRDTLGFIHNSEVHRIVKALEKRELLSRSGAGRVRRIRLHTV